MMSSLFNLPIDQQISSSIALVTKDELPVMVFNHPKCKAAISLQGAHLIAWQPVNQQPVIWLSENTPLKQGVAIRGGVPICWPWFGKVAEPGHGFARNLMWEVTEHSENDQGVYVKFTLRDDEYTHTLWEHDFHLTIEFTLGERCYINLISYGEYFATTAIHTYLQIGDIDQVSISGLGEIYFDKVLGSQQEMQTNELIFAGEIDRIYSAPEAISRVHDVVYNRVIRLEHFNNSDVVSWNPGKANSIKMTDMTDNGYKTMVCVETAKVNVPLMVEIGEPASISVVISVE